MKFIKPEFEKIALNNLDVVLIASYPSITINKTTADFDDTMGIIEGIATN